MTAESRGAQIPSVSTKDSPKCDKYLIEFEIERAKNNDTCCYTIEEAEETMGHNT